MFKTKKSCFLKILGTALLSAFTGAASGYAVDLNGEWLGEKPEWAPTVTGATSFMTKYIWRGQNLGNDPVIQPEAAISKWGLTASF